MARKENTIKHLLLKPFNSTAAGFYLLLLAVSIGAATFVENDFGTSAAQKLIYKSTWFEVLLVLFSITLVVNIVQYRFVQTKKWALLIFHSAMIIILAGAAHTRYFGYEGIMHIREGSSSDVIYSGDSYLNFQVQLKGQNYAFHEPVLFASVGDNSMEKSYLIGDRELKVNVLSVVPKPTYKLKENENGVPTIKVVFGGATGREEFFIQKGEVKNIHGVQFNFSDLPFDGGVKLISGDNQLQLLADRPINRMIMATRTKDTLQAMERHSLALRALHSYGSKSFVFAEYHPKAALSLVRGGDKLDKSDELAVNIELEVQGEKYKRTLFGAAGNLGKPALVQTGDLALAVDYGARKIELPFSLHLHDFQMERYPGTNSPASFASEVTLVDPGNGIEQPHRIFMNHILDYGGYRFFQSSYDRDEKGTYLSVNHDGVGTAITYLGYALLTIGLIMIFFSKKTRFRQLAIQAQRIRQKPNVIIALFLAGFLSVGTETFAQAKIEAELSVVAQSHADRFSRVVVQDHRGRMKPMHTLSREVLRKVHGNEEFETYSAEQVLLGLYANKQNWYGVKLIKVGKNEQLKQVLGVKGKYASYRDFFTVENGGYKLSKAVAEANNTKPAEQNNFHKQVIKLDERLNILNMIFSGSLLRLVPVPDDPNKNWVAEHSGTTHTKDPVAQRFFSSYQSALHQSMHSGDYSYPNQIIEELGKYQRKMANDIMPSQTKLNAEILLNRSKVFNRLAVYYSILGLVFLGILFLGVFKPEAELSKWQKALVILVFAGFVAHTLGLGIRWYVSGRAPWSNGYESMIYIAWTSTLAGMLFTRKSAGAMAATLVLAGTVLLIAMLSSLDPEITPLVPVLKSYWLTIHVSLEAGSYGFLMLGAIIGFINLALMAVTTKNNKKKTVRLIKEMSYISEMTLIGGLVMLSIGTYLGGVWANESWGRYWGWDAKETWALVSILVYAFILHMRIIPSLKGLFAYNFATLFGLSSIIMTYFGVNYYLSGLHSYAAGDPVPIPNWVYWAVSSLVLMSALAFYKHKKFTFQ